MKQLELGFNEKRTRTYDGKKWGRDFAFSREPLRRIESGRYDQILEILIDLHRSGEGASILDLNRRGVGSAVVQEFFRDARLCRFARLRGEGLLLGRAIRLTRAGVDFCLSRGIG